MAKLEKDNSKIEFSSYKNIGLDIGFIKFGAVINKIFYNIFSPLVAPEAQKLCKIAHI